MKLSAPIHILKSRAKSLKKERGITLSEALNEVAKSEGFNSWSLLQSKAQELFLKRKEDVLGFLNPGDLMLIAARPGLGKTSFTLEILVQAMKEGRKCYFFSLEYRLKDIAARLADIDESVGHYNENLKFDFSDDISSHYIKDATQQESESGFIIAIDYLQLLDQKRSNPELQVQVKELKEYAKSKGCIILFISQVDRSFEDSARKSPLLKDVRMPNPVDLELFNKNIFLHNGKMVFNNTIDLIVD